MMSMPWASCFLATSGFFKTLLCSSFYTHIGFSLGLIRMGLLRIYGH